MITNEQSLLKYYKLCFLSLHRFISISSCWFKWTKSNLCIAIMLSSLVSLYRFYFVNFLIRIITFFMVPWKFSDLFFFFYKIHLCYQEIWDYTCRSEKYNRSFSAENFPFNNCSCVAIFCECFIWIPSFLLFFSVSAKDGSRNGSELF